MAANPYATAGLGAVRWGALGDAGERRPRPAARRARPGRRRPRAAPARRHRGPPAQPASAARSVLRRWANAASTTANTSARVALVTGGSRRCSATSPESTLGTGQNTLRPTEPARRTSRVPARLHRRHAVGPRARRGREPVGDLGLHHHQHPLQRRQHARAGAAAPGPRRCTAGWPRARSAAGPADRRGRSAARRRSRRCSRSARLGARSADGPRQLRRRARASISTAMTAAATRQQRRASASRGRVPPRARRRRGRHPAARTMRRTVFGSMTKFWPRFLVGRRPSSAASARTRPGRAATQPVGAQRTGTARVRGACRSTATRLRRPAAGRAASRGRSARPATRRSGCPAPPTPCQVPSENW